MVKDNSNLSPEKQLLKLIEEPHALPSRGAAIRGKGITLFSFGALQGRWIFAREKLAGLAKACNGPFDIKKLNSLLVLLAVSMFIYFMKLTKLALYIHFLNFVLVIIDMFLIFKFVF